MLFKFDIKGMQKLYEHAHEYPNLTAREPSFILVIDRSGVYMLENGRREEGKSAEELGLVFYAENCNSKKDENWRNIYEAVKSEITGDDMAEKISCKWLNMILELDDTREFLMLEITTHNRVILTLEEEF